MFACGQKCGGTHCCKANQMASPDLQNGGTHFNAVAHLMTCESTGMALFCPNAKYKTSEAILVPTPSFIVIVQGK